MQKDNDFLDSEMEVPFDTDENEELSLEPDDDLLLDLTATDDEDDSDDFEALPTGFYNAIIENTEYEISKENKNPMIKWTFSVTDEEYRNRLLFLYTTLNNQWSIKKIRKILTQVLPHVDISAFAPKRFCLDGAALGYPCRVKVGQKKYEGRYTNDVKDVLAPQGDNAGMFLDR